MADKAMTHLVILAFHFTSDNMKAISLWASQHQKTAIVLIAVFEVLKMLIGFDIGHHFLPGLTSGGIELGVLVLVFLITFVQTNYRHRAGTLCKEALRRFRLINTGIIMSGSLFLSILLGNQFKNQGYAIHHIFMANAAVRVTSPPADHTKSNSANTSAEKKSRKKIVSRLLAKKALSDDDNGGQRIIYFLLFVLSLVLTIGGVLLTCNLACGGYGLLAVLAFLLSLGILSGGLYFLIRAFKRDIKPFQSLTKKEKKKEQLKFFVIWILIGAAIGLVAFINSL